MNKSEMQSAMLAVRSVVETNPYDAVEAARALHSLADLAPHHVKSVVTKAEQAIVKSTERSGSGYDGLARYALKQVMTAMERSFMPVAK